MAADHWMLNAWSGAQAPAFATLAAACFREAYASLHESDDLDAYCERHYSLEASRALLEKLATSAAELERFFGRSPEQIDRTDGLRLTFKAAQGDEIVHLRPSGNAPELRCYAEASTESRAAELVTENLGRAAAAKEA